MSERRFGCWLYHTDRFRNYSIEWTKWVELPFAPFVGMPTIQFGGDDADKGPDFSPHHVVFVPGDDETDDVFWCQQQECVEAESTEKERAAFLREGGWKKHAKYDFGGMDDTPIKCVLAPGAVEAVRTLLRRRFADYWPYCHSFNVEHLLTLTREELEECGADSAAVVSWLTTYGLALGGETVEGIIERYERKYGSLAAAKTAVARRRKVKQAESGE